MIDVNNSAASKTGSLLRQDPSCGLMQSRRKISRKRIEANPPERQTWGLSWQFPFIKQFEMIQSFLQVPISLFILISKAKS